MGASLNYIEVKATPKMRKDSSFAKKKIQEQWDRAWKATRNFSGSDPYSGALCTLKRKVNFVYFYGVVVTKEIAVKNLENKSEKWEYPICVAYRNSIRAKSATHYLIGGWCAK